MSKNGNPFCSKLLHFAYRCQCSCKAKCSNYYILQRYYILGCDTAAFLFIINKYVHICYDPLPVHNSFVQITFCYQSVIEFSKTVIYKGEHSL